MTFEIEGMHCDACIRRVTRALTRDGAATVEEVSIGRATVAAAPGSAPALLAALADAGFNARVQP